ncbi:MAG: hypothetical protein ABDH21_02605 [bacterium]
MIRNLLYVFIVLTALSWFLFAVSYIIPFKTYSIYVYIEDKNTALQVYRKFQDYLKSIDKEAQKYIKLHKISVQKKVLVNQDYSYLILGVRESMDFLSKKLKVRMQKRGYYLSIVQVEEDGTSIAYLKDLIFVPLIKVSQKELDDINEKYLNFYKEDKLVDYIKFLRSYFSDVNADKIGRIQFFISRNFLINFCLMPYTTSKVINLHVIKVENVPKKENLIQLQQIVTQYKKGKFHISTEEEERIVNLRVLNKREK